VVALISSFDSDRGELKETSIQHFEVDCFTAKVHKKGTRLGFA
jgi:hypothetical protein